MAHHRHLNKAPIREAIIDLKVSPPGELTKLTPLFESLKGKFPKQEEIRESEFGFEVGQNEIRPKPLNREVRGCRLSSSDGRYIVQLRVDGFTFSRLPPYDTWETMSAEAKPIWEMFRTHCSAKKVTRAAVRYINLMELPVPILDFREYLSAPPEVPPALPQEIGGFFSRVVLLHRELDVAAFVTQTLEASVGNKAQIVLDIDVFREARDRDWLTSDPSVWQSLEQMRNFKNLVFFESITEKTAEIFQ